MEPGASGIALDHLGCPISSKCMNTLQCLHFHFYIYCLHRLLTPEVSLEEIALWT